MNTPPVFDTRTAIHVESQTTFVPGGLLLHPIVLFSVFLWAVNDHVLKSAWGNGFTGKFSDVVCQIAFPVLLVAAWETIRSWRGRGSTSARAYNRALLWAIAITGVVMATINTLECAAWCYEYGLGLAQWPLRGLLATLMGLSWPEFHPVALTMDPTDLLTLPALVVPWRLGRRRVST